MAIYYELQTLHNGKWTNDPSCLGQHCTDKDNHWHCYGSAAIAFYELVTTSGFDASTLRINTVDETPDL